MWARAPRGPAADPARVRQSIAHLYRRAGFGAGPDQLDEGVAAGYAATVDRVVDRAAVDANAEALGPPEVSRLPNPLPADGDARRAVQEQGLRQTRGLVLWWLDRMVVSTTPLREKLTWLWHGHFTTGYSRVRDPVLLYRQNQLLRSLGAGNFDTLTQAVARDPAMLVWLDSNTNSKGHPNENFSRELLELFTLGIGNYSEVDVSEGARAFTGWAYDADAQAFLMRADLHDDGIKAVLGASGPLDGGDVVRTAIRSPASARWVVARLWSHLAYPVAPSDPAVGELAPAFATDLDISNLLRAIFLHPAFLSPAARSGLVKQPVEHLVGALRALGQRADSLVLLDGIRAQGQMPLDPPNVGGWPQNTYWLGTAAALGRLRLADTLAGRADLSSLASVPPAERTAAVGRVLSVDEWSPRTAGALARVADDPKTLLTAALVAPEYLLN